MRKVLRRAHQRQSCCLSKIKQLTIIDIHILKPSSKNFEQLKKLQDQQVNLLWSKLNDDKKRNIVLLLLEQLTGVPN